MAGVAGAGRVICEAWGVIGGWVSAGGFPCPLAAASGASAVAVAGARCPGVLAGMLGA